MKLQKLAGTTSEILYVFIQDSTATDGSGLTGLAYNTSGLTAYYVRKGGSATAITLAVMPTPAVDDVYTSGGFIEVDATNCPGLYRFDPPNAVLAAGVESVIVFLQGAANMVPCLLEIQLTAVNFDDSVRGGMSAFPNVSTGGSGALPVNTDLTGVSEIFGEDLSTYTTEGTAGEILRTSGLTSDKIETALEDDGASGYQYTTLALENAPGGGGSTDVNVVNVAGVAVSSIDDFKADVSALALEATVGALNDFDPATDIVAHVTLVDTTTTNTDMRGTDNAATQASVDIIDANVDAILVDTSTTIPAALSALSTFDPTTDEVETGESYQQMISDIRAVLRGKTDTTGTKFYRADDTTEAFTVAIASGNRTFTEPA